MIVFFEGFLNKRMPPRIVNSSPNKAILTESLVLVIVYRKTHIPINTRINTTKKYK